MTTTRPQSSELRAQNELDISPQKSSSGASPKSYRNLKAWPRSIELSVSVYRLTYSFPREEVYGLTSQLRRMARGSVLELQTQLVIAKDTEKNHNCKKLKASQKRQEK